MIWVHIGLRKAGSTSIQNFLQANEAGLRALSVDYPRIGCQTRNNHLNLAREIRGLPDFDPNGGTIAELAREWRAAPSDSLVLSAEAFEECETEQALRLGELRQAAEEEIRIIIVIRDLIELMPSSYSQMVKLGVKIHTFDDFFEKRMSDRRIDYFATAKRWADAFGWERLRVRLLDRRQLRNGDLIDDFLSVVGVDPDDERARRLRRPGAANVGPGWRVIESIRALHSNRHGLPETHPLANASRRGRDQREKLGRRALAVAEPMGWNADRGQYLTRKQARLCLETYRGAITALNRHLTVKLPQPLTLAQRDFPHRDVTPDVAQIPPAQLRAFYDALADAV